MAAHIVLEHTRICRNNVMLKLLCLGVTLEGGKNCPKMALTRWSAQPRDGFKTKFEFLLPFLENRAESDARLSSDSIPNIEWWSYWIVVFPPSGGLNRVKPPVFSSASLASNQVVSAWRAYVLNICWQTSSTYLYIVSYPPKIGWFVVPPDVMLHHHFSPFVVAISCPSRLQWCFALLPRWSWSGSYCFHGWCRRVLGRLRHGTIFQVPGTPFGPVEATLHRADLHQISIDCDFTFRMFIGIGLTLNCACYSVGGASGCN